MTSVVSIVERLSQIHKLCDIRSSLKLLTKIIANLIEHPDEDKFRDLNFAKIKNKFETGMYDCSDECIRLLKIIGFRFTYVQQQQQSQTANQKGPRLIIDKNKPHVATKQQLQVIYETLLAIININVNAGANTNTKKATNTHTNNHLKYLLSMGFTPQQSQHALSQVRNNLNLAIEYLLDPQRKVEQEITDEVKTNTNTNSESKSTKVLDRLGSVLRLYSQRKLNVLRLDVKQMLDDYMCVLARIQNPDREDYSLQLVDAYLRREYGLDCVLSKCMTVRINTRDRMAARPSKRILQLKANELLICTIHCVLLHSIDSGYALTQQELDEEMAVQREQRRKEEEDERDECDEQELYELLYDKQAIRLIRMLSARREHYAGLRQDMDVNGDNTNNNNHATASKFVSVVPAEPEQEQEQGNQEVGNGQCHNASLSAYSFGIKFYYWAKFRNNRAVDHAYNGGRYRYCDWYVAAKYDSLKQELMQNKIRTITALTWKQEQDKVRAWINTKIVKKMKVRLSLDYNLFESTPIGESRLLAVALYTNLTGLSSVFSGVFRRIPDSEPDDALRRRHANYRQWARLLVEAVHQCGMPLGTEINLKKLERMLRNKEEFVVRKMKNFYHGITCQLTFSTMYAVLCAPTSTTDSVNVAVMFANTGLVLELERRDTMGLSCFNCVMSDYASEQEYLFIAGGFFSGESESHGIALPFVTIRSIELSLDYAPLVIAISALQQIMAGVRSFKNKTKSKKANATQLAKLIEKSSRVNELELNQRNRNRRGLLQAECDGRKWPLYIQSMFDSYVQSVNHIRIFIPGLNAGHLIYHGQSFSVYRSLLCELYPQDVLDVNQLKWAINKKDFKPCVLFDGRSHVVHSLGYVNPIRSLRFDLLLRLFANLVSIEILQLPITHYLMDRVLHIFETRRPVLIQRVFLGEWCFAYKVSEYRTYGRLLQGVAHQCYPQCQNDFRTYTECVRQYQDRFAAQRCKIELVVEAKGVGIPGFSHIRYTGLEIVLQSNTFYGADYFATPFKCHR